MWSFQALCDDFYVNSRLYLKLELTPSRETLLHFFEQIRRNFPSLTRLRKRDDGGMMLDEEVSDAETRRYVRLEVDALKIGYSSPPDSRAVGQFVEMVLTQAPYDLSLSDLDYDRMEVVFGFDLEYRGNHDELIYETFFGDHPLLAALAPEKHRVIECQPYFGVTLNDECTDQAYLDIKSRTPTYEVRAGEYEPAALSIYLTVRRYSGSGGPWDLVRTHRELMAIGERLAVERVVPNVVQPLAAAIASRR